MEIKVNEDELDLVKTTMDKDAQDLASSIESLTQQIEILRGIWQGQDADKFFGNARDYFEKMKSIPNCMANMGRFIDRANGDFNEGDESFSKELMTEVDEQYIKDDGSYAVSNMRSGKGTTTLGKKGSTSDLGKAGSEGGYMEASGVEYMASGSSIEQASGAVNMLREKISSKGGKN